MTIIGIGHGVYFGTDLAQVTGVSRPHASGKDLGLLNVANTLRPSYFRRALIYSSP